jgi:hypothetical protein
MNKYILRIENGADRCKDEPRYIYLKQSNENVDITTTMRKDAKVFLETDEVTVHSKDWKFIKIN